MSKIRSTNTRPEMAVRSYLFSQGFRYRLHDPNLPGKPDIILPKYRTVILVHGCFWHRHKGCVRATNPQTNVEYWNHKFEMNQARDKRTIAALKLQGWKVIVVWECGLKGDKKEKTLAKLVKNIKVGFIGTADRQHRQSSPQ